MRRQTTIHWRGAGVRQAVPVLLAAVLVLGGCSATYVGDAWQCPVAQGAACTSVADADPAVKKAESAQALAVPELPGPLGPGGAHDPGETEAACAGGCDPFAWLADWFSAFEEPHDGAGPVEPVSTSPSEDPSDASRQSLRTEERIARIWIAPFVDSGGVYREAHWVRAVLEPARWRAR